MKRLAIIGVLLVLGVACIGYAAGRFWTVDFKHTGLRYITVKDPLRGNMVVPYLLYTVQNNTGADHDIHPIFQIVTDTGQTTYAIPSPIVLKEIEKKHGEKYFDVDKIEGSLKNGEDARKGVAIFRGLDPKADHLKLYISGLTDAYRYQDEEKREGFQRRVYHIYWYRPGDSKDRAEDPVETKFDDWMWRSTGTAESAPEEK